MDEPKTPAAVGEKPDKRRTPPSGDRRTNFRLMPEGFVPDFDQVTAVCTVAFTPEGLIVACEEERGPDLPGGHVQEGEESAEQTARREADEEAGIKFGAVHFLRAIESDRYGSAPEDLTYMVIMAAIVSEQGPVPSGMTRHIMTEEQFLSHQPSSYLRQGILPTLVAEARKLLFPKI